MFVIAKAIEGIAGKPVMVKRLVQAGLLLIEVDRKHYAINLLKANKLHDIPVEISPHRTLNSCKGVITCKFRNNMEDMTDEEFKQELIGSGQSITDVYRIMTTKQGRKEATNTYIITFDGTKPPEKIVIGFIQVNVRTYVPNPRRCYKCQQFGHTTKFCSHESACENCGGSGHDRSDCGNPTKCVNCGEAHPASSRDCSQWKLKKEILEYKSQNDVTYTEAENKVLENRQKPTGNTHQSYSSVAASLPSKPKSCDVSVQTEMTWPETFSSPVLTSDCIISNVDKSVQSATNMDYESANAKRSRGDSPPSHDSGVA